MDSLLMFRYNGRRMRSRSILCVRKYAMFIVDNYRSLKHWNAIYRRSFFYGQTAGLAWNVAVECLGGVF
jgi:hypothetical protein